jgi:hypothetical protein
MSKRILLTFSLALVLSASMPSRNAGNLKGSNPSHPVHQSLFERVVELVVRLSGGRL